MAKKPGKTLSTISPATLAAVVAPATTPPIPVITVPAGGTLAVIVDVGPMSIPYTVSYAGRTLIKALVDRAEPVPLIAGEQVLSWSFSHVNKNWHHAIGVSVNGGAPVVLESKSEADKDQDHSLGLVIVKAL
jgi:hypothetical protein